MDKCLGQDVHPWSQVETSNNQTRQQTDEDVMILLKIHRYIIIYIFIYIYTKDIFLGTCRHVVPNEGHPFSTPLSLTYCGHIWKSCNFIPLNSLPKTPCESGSCKETAAVRSLLATWRPTFRGGVVGTVLQSPSLGRCLKMDEICHVGKFHPFSDCW